MVGERFGAALVVRDVAALLVFQRCTTRKKFVITLAGLVADCPKNTALEQLMKTVVVPHALIVTRGGVKDAAFALRANPCPGLRLGMRIAFHCVTHHQHRAVLRIVVGVKVSFVPGGEFLHVLQCGVIRLHDLGGKLRALVALEPPADKLIEAWFVAEAPARAMYWHEAAAVLDIVLQVGPLVRLDSAVVGV